MNGRTPPESACNRIAAARPAVALDGTKIHIADIASRTGGKEINMAKDTHVTAPTRFIKANGIRYAYRRFGSESGTPLVFLQHFRGGLDNWDPLVTDGLAQGRPVILFNNAGVASSSGETPNTIEAMGDHVAAFVNALGLPQVDVLGFSIGGYVAQSFVLRHPNLVRRLVLAGTGPRNGETVEEFACFGSCRQSRAGLRGFFVSLLRAFGSKSGGRKGILGSPSSAQGC